MTSPADTYVDLDTDQAELLRRHADLLTVIRARTRDGSWTGPNVTVAVCPECGRWMLLTGGSAPASCSLSLDCPGKPAKASVARLDQPGAR